MTLRGVNRIINVECDCPEVHWAKEIWIQPSGSSLLLVATNIAADKDSTYVLTPDDPRYELFMNPKVQGRVLAEHRETEC